MMIRKIWQTELENGRHNVWRKSTDDGTVKSIDLFALRRLSLMRSNRASSSASSSLGSHPSSTASQDWNYGWKRGQCSHAASDDRWLTASRKYAGPGARSRLRSHLRIYCADCHIVNLHPTHCRGVSLLSYLNPSLIVLADSSLIFDSKFYLFAHFYTFLIVSTIFFFHFRSYLLLPTIYNNSSII